MRPERRWRSLVRLAVVIWLLVVQPVSLALTLHHALPRIALFGVIAWTLVAARVALVVAGIALARRLRAHESDAWRTVALWASAAIASTLFERAFPELPTNLAPSEARVAAIAAIGRDAALALVAVWLARADLAVDPDRARAGDSS